MNIGLVSLHALRTVANETVEKKLHLCGKIIRDLERAPDEASERLCGDLRSILKSVKNSAGVSSEQVEQAGTLILRIRDFDPRRLRRLADGIEEDAEESVTPPSGTLSLSFDGLRDSLSTALGAPLWQQYGSGKCDLDVKQRTAVLEAVLRDLPLSVSNVERLFAELHARNESGWALAGSFQIVTRIAQEWLALHGAVEPPKVDDASQNIRDRLKLSWEQGHGAKQ